MAMAPLCRADMQDRQQAFRLNPTQMRHQRTWDNGDTTVTARFNKQGVAMQRQLSCGAPLSMALPNRTFEGVAATALDNGDGTQTMTLELRHKDPALSIPLACGEDAEQMVEDWCSWAARCELPLLIVGTNGEAEIVKSGPTSGAPQPRRSRITSITHRPRFLRRRKVGRVSPVARVEPHDIIARV